MHIYEYIYIWGVLVLTTYLLRILPQHVMILAKPVKERQKDRVTKPHGKEFSFVG